MALGKLYIKILIYPIFYLLKGDYIMGEVDDYALRVMSRHAARDVAADAAPTASGA